MDIDYPNKTRVDKFFTQEFKKADRDDRESIIKDIPMAKFLMILYKLSDHFSGNDSIFDVCKSYSSGYVKDLFRSVSTDRISLDNNFSVGHLPRNIAKTEDFVIFQPKKFSDFDTNGNYVSLGDQTYGDIVVSSGIWFGEKSISRFNYEESKSGKNFYESTGEWTSGHLTLKHSSFDLEELLEVARVLWLEYMKYNENFEDCMDALITLSHTFVSIM